MVVGRRVSGLWLRVEGIGARVQGSEPALKTEHARRNTQDGTRNLRRLALQWAIPIALVGLLLLETWTPLTLQSAVQVAVAPPTFALKVNRPEEIHFSYQRYLVRSLRLAFGFTGSPIRLSLRRASTSRPRRGARR